MIIYNQYQGDDDTVLNLHDLLTDEHSDVLSEYLTVSVTNDGQDTRLTVATTEESPTAYSSVFYGVAADDLQTLLIDNTPDLTVSG